MKRSAEIHDDCTPKKRALSKKEEFLLSFAEHGIVMKAAQSAGISRRVVYQWLEHDEAFAFAFNQAKEEAKDVIRAEIYRRAKEGWDEEVYQLGHYAGTVRKFSDTLLIFHAKMLMPEYRDKQQLDVNANMSVQTADLSHELRMLSADQLAQLKTWLLAAKAGNQS